MATIATALSDQHLEAELRRLQTEAASFRKKLDDDTNKLSAARAEQRRIAEGIARGTVRESEAPRNQSEIDSIEIRIEGYNSVLADNRSTTNELGQELGRRQHAAAKAAREKEFADLKEHGAALGKKIQDLLVQLCTEDLPAFDAVRRRLAFEFADLDGHAAAVSLVELFIKHPRGLEALRNPEVHLARLEASGWGYATPFQRSPAESTQFPLQLTVFPMLPMPKQ